MKLKARYTSAFKRDLKRLKKQHADINEAMEVVQLILNNDEPSIEILLQRHRMHKLNDFKGVWECHINNAGDRLLIWLPANGIAEFIRICNHDELTRSRDLVKSV